MVRPPARRPRPGRAGHQAVPRTTPRPTQRGARVLRLPVSTGTHRLAPTAADRPDRPVPNPPHRPDRQPRGVLGNLRTRHRRRSRAVRRVEQLLRLGSGDVPAAGLAARRGRLHLRADPVQPAQPGPRNGGATSGAALRHRRDDLHATGRRPADRQGRLDGRIRTAQVEQEYGISLGPDNTQFADYSTLCHDLGETETAVAIAWTLHHPAVDSAIVGVRTVEQLDGLDRAAELRLSPETIARLDEIFDINRGRKIRKASRPRHTPGDHSPEARNQQERKRPCTPRKTERARKGRPNLSGRGGCSAAQNANQYHCSPAIRERLSRVLRPAIAAPSTGIRGRVLREPARRASPGSRWLQRPSTRGTATEQWPQCLPALSSRACADRRLWVRERG